LASHNPSQPINHVHHIPHSGLFMLTHEASDLSTLYVPGLGRAPKWCSFLDNVTDDVEKSAGDGAVGAGWEDYRFVERGELVRLGLDSLLGTPALKPYMHGYFVHLRLYDTARVAADPIGWEQHRERVIKEKMDKLADSRIRTRKSDQKAVKVNQRLAERIQQQQEKEEKKAQRLLKRRAENGEAEALDDTNSKKEKDTLLSDPRFKAMFEDTAFEVDENSREWTLLNPSSAASTSKLKHDDSESEQEESDEEEEDAISEEGESDSEADELVQRKSSVDPRGRYHPYSNPRPLKTPKMVPMQLDSSGESLRHQNGIDRENSTFGQRRRGYSGGKHTDAAKGANDGAEISWVPSSEKIDEGRKKGDGSKIRRGEKSFTLQRGGGPDDSQKRDISENERKGRTKRRTGIRSGSRNVFRRM